MLQITIPTDELTFDGVTQKSTWQNVDDGNRQTENVWLALCEETSEY